MKYCVILVVGMLLAACGGPPDTASHPSQQVVVTRQTASLLHIPQIPPVELGHRPSNIPMTDDTMPYFDIVTYCELTTRGQDTSRLGPHYETCADDQSHYRSIVGSALDAGKLQPDDIIRCAKATRTAYQGEWYCLNGREF